MLYFLHQLEDQFSVLRVFEYQTFRAAGACISAFLISIICGNWVILKLTSLKLGQPVRTAAEVHKLAELHGNKGGTPTMGGVLILGAVLLSVGLWARPDNPLIWMTMFVFVSLGVLGFFDDYAKVKRKNSAGVSARVKLIAQFGVSVVSILILYAHPGTAGYIREFYVPFLKDPLIKDMGWFGVLLLPLVIIACSNAVNLTDGLDGLATGCTISVAMTYGVFAYAAGHAVASEYLNVKHNVFAGEVAIVCAALVGAGMGFLWFNCHPARVFMGDTGSLAIGGLLGAVAICCKQEVVLIIVGGVFVAEALSVILQVGSFKLRGKRIFKMAPLHHHFELLGWKESKVITRFWIVSIMFALAGLMTLKLR